MVQRGFLYHVVTGSGEVVELVLEMLGPGTEIRNQIVPEG